jgi:hypothetical protein
MSKATNTHSECEISIVFTLQQLLHERASILLVSYTPIASPVLLENKHGKYCHIIRAKFWEPEISLIL